MSHRVVVTGLGAVSPNGIGKNNFWENTCKGVSGIKRISSFDASNLSCQIAGEVQGLNPAEYYSETDLKKLPRAVPLAIAASKEALDDAAIDLEQFDEEDFESMGVIVGTGGAGFDFSERQFEIYFSGKKNKISPYAISNSLVGMLSSEISMYFGLQGRSHVISNGCTSSTDAIGYAFNTIRSGQQDWVLTGGVEACVTPAMMCGFERMRVNPTNFNDEPSRGSRPFNSDREGFVLSEGSWMMILEELEHAKRRDAQIYGEILGYGSTCDAYHRVTIMPDGKQSTRAICMALKDARINKERVGYINFHGTSTIVNDKVETLAVKNAFTSLAAKIPVSSTKSMVGHPQGASGGLGVSVSLLSLHNNFLTPTINQEKPDPECDLDYVSNEGRENKLDIAISNCISFGSKNSALVLGKFSG
ncbi:MAG TPA: beta-ketoacyl-[acyl-carrier-protein] synthase family protein [Nitrospinaceae bacterium]|jgi:3-oxoacyl-[acyl-carrier-protein] synthase II|nr:beta-ketoacyl-[acyl-carrier-protein] synthase family protein [Nitrospinaceae bacterium]MDP7147569.1 beta-ketoacyl-[acyl-carrier-protein] synthase family protein [Nitrospinaceae bacterium]MDP7611789.1 beta-ketoacyl-[acyl-carrier-protein] synthase family protein [Nitrospinaceae bacterium]HAX45807.1 beta-ketoacyl synthase [Nitrospina sp.]HJO58591.1 beta-ketoacyl-[acyl-carrier-protein] synthase family protein [Nitrospinaceae bacterium]|tara:strand:+ start:2138 stop:3391 length:1254 start_codon:yes stop_codon:yes gene_type:complete